MTTIEAKTLKNSLTAALNAAGNDQARPALTRIYAEYGLGTLIFTAADGFRMTTATIDAPGMTGPTPKKNAPIRDHYYNGLYSPETIKAMIKALPNKGTVTLTATPYSDAITAMTLTINGTNYTALDTADIFPDYRYIQAGRSSTQPAATFAAADFIPAAEATKTISKCWIDKDAPKAQQTPPPTRLYASSTAANIALITNSEQYGTARRDFPANAKTDFMFLVNAKYLHDTLRNATGIITLHYSKHNQPVFFTYANIQTVIMPMLSDKCETYNPATPEIHTPVAAPSYIYTPLKYRGQDTANFISDREVNRPNPFPYKKVDYDIFSAQPTSTAAEFIIDNIQNTIENLPGNKHDEQQAQINLIGTSRRILPTPAAENAENTPILAPTAEP